MTDPRRQTIAALQAKPGDIELLIANRVLCGPSLPPMVLAIIYRLATRPPCLFVLRIVARWLGIIPSDYDQSADAGEPMRWESLTMNPHADGTEKCGTLPMEPKPESIKRKRGPTT